MCIPIPIPMQTWISLYSGQKSESGFGQTVHTFCSGHFSLPFGWRQFFNKHTTVEISTLFFELVPAVVFSQQSIVATVIYHQFQGFLPTPNICGVTAAQKSTIFAITRILAIPKPGFCVRTRCAGSPRPRSESRPDFQKV